MPRFDYAPLKVIAGALIDQFGTDGTLRRYDASTSFDAAAQSYTDYAIIYVVTDYARGELPQSLVQNNGRKVLISAVGLTVEPALSDKLVIDSVEYELLPPLMPLKPATVTIMYEAQVVF